ncbi:MAG: hypothetical protein MK212_00010 [Saprospiraceae bacterium]|nr:hypothetical protein [Saprospiraceae bacterium]
MSIKIKLKPNVLDKLTFAKYATLLRVKIQKVKKLGKSVPCLIFTDHSFPDPKLKGKLLPLILIGDVPTVWDKLYKDRKKADAKLGMCSVPADQPTFSFEQQGGKTMKPDALKRMRLVLKQAKITNFELSENIKDNDKGNPSPKVAAAAGAVAGGTPKANPEEKKKQKRAKKVAKAKEILGNQGKELGKVLKAYKAQYKVIQSKVVPKLKSGRTNRKDLTKMRSIQEVRKDFMKKFSEANKKIQGKFSSAKAQIEKQELKLAKLSLSVKKHKSTMAQQIADSYFNKKKKRKATEDEVKLFQENLKKGIAYRKVNEFKGEERTLHLKAVVQTLKLRGTKFKVEDTDKVYNKLAA